MAGMKENRADIAESAPENKDNRLQVFLPNKALRSPEVN